MTKNEKHFLWNAIDLEQLRQQMDGSADEAVAAVYDSKSMEHLRELLTEMAKNDNFVSRELPVVMHDFVQNVLSTQFTPHDIELFRQTHEIWKEHGMKFVFILFFRALPYTYMAEKPANVLVTTRLLETHTERRIFETAQFVFDVMDENWWEPEKRGILTALKVRIMHAAMRHVILNNQGEKKWNNDWGMPISQEDLLATNQVFSLEFFKGMEMLGQPLSPQQQEAWFHTWKTIGRIMGVNENLIPVNVSDGWKLQHTVYDHLFNDKTIAGIPLTSALVNTLDQFHLPLKLILFMMKQMLADDQFPDCFDRMLKPTYEQIYPELFEEHDSDEAKENHNALLKKQFHQHVNEYYHIIKQKRPDYTSLKPKVSLLEKIIFLLMMLFGRGKKQMHLIEIHLEKIHNHIHVDGTEDPVDELEEGAIIDIMSSLGGIMVGILSFHFRKGKDSGFRIPRNLKEHWSLH